MKNKILKPFFLRIWESNNIIFFCCNFEFFFLQKSLEILKKKSTKILYVYFFSFFEGIEKMLSSILSIMYSEEIKNSSWIITYNFIMIIFLLSTFCTYLFYIFIFFSSSHRVSILHSVIFIFASEWEGERKSFKEYSWNV